jgi:DNA-binding MarR family transcriptional regulator
MAKEFTGVWIPKAIYQGQDLNPADKLILADIFNLCENGGLFFKSNATIANEINISIRSVSRSIKKLTDLNYVSCKYDGRTRVVILTSTLDTMTNSLDTSTSTIDKLTRQQSQSDSSAKPNSLNSIHSKEHFKEPFRKQQSKEIVFPFEEKEFLDTWEIWIDERQENGIKNYTARGEQGALTNLAEISDYDYQTAIDIINESIINGWHGLFELRGI